MKIFLALSLLLCCLLTLVTGEIPFSLVWQDLLKRIDSSSTEWNALLDERIPRLIVILSSGASLAVAGAVMQALFQNPLASPSLLGLSCGGSLAVIPVLLGEWHVSFPFSIPIASFLGCLGTLLLVYFLTRKQGEVTIHSLILTGIAVSTLLLSLQGALLYAFRDKWQLVQMLTEWEAGSTLDRSWTHVHMQLPLTIAGLIGCWNYRRELNLLTLGDEEALNMGVDVTRVRWELFLYVALLTGGTLAAVGIIAFFGFVLPHLLRQMLGPNHLLLIPYCIVGGATFFAFLDLFLRLSGIHFLSIGNISAILGGLFFLFLLLTFRRHSYA